MFLDKFKGSWRVKASSFKIVPGESKGRRWVKKSR